jgi:hypothetical protein
VILLEIHISLACTGRPAAVIVKLAVSDALSEVGHKNINRIVMTASWKCRVDNSAHFPPLQLSMFWLPRHNLNVRTPGIEPAALP